MQSLNRRDGVGNTRGDGQLYLLSVKEVRGVKVVASCPHHMERTLVCSPSVKVIDPIIDLVKKPRILAVLATLL